MSIFDALNNGIRQSGLAVDATYTNSDDEETELRVVFYNAWVDLNGVSSQRPIAGLNTADLDDEPVKGDTLTINSVDYTVKDVQKDGTGWATLILQKA